MFDVNFGDESGGLASFRLSLLLSKRYTNSLKVASVIASTFPVEMPRHLP